nr:SRPBCC domain-containing protein [Brucella anthropi]
MKFVQEFQVAESVVALWKIFEQPEVVAECMPGMESIQAIGTETFIVLVTQKVGPISATFESRVMVTERVENDRIAFSATGKAVRGAIGNFRAESVVTLHPRDGGTLVRVESEAALAGVLGSVGQKIIAKQAEKITAQFATNLQARLSGAAVSSAATTASPGATAETIAARANVSPAYRANPSLAHAAAPLPAAPSVGDSWSKATVVLGLVNAMIGLAILISLN